MTSSRGRSGDPVGALFYVTSRELKVGDQKGYTWGPTVLATGPAHAWYDREMALEEIRVLIAPRAPSRLMSAFAFEGLGILEQEEWVTPTGGPRFVYRVELEPAARVFRGDISWITRHREATTEVERIRAMVAYWSGLATRDGSVFEVLSSRPLTIVGLERTFTA